MWIFHVTERLMLRQNLQKEMSSQTLVMNICRVSLHPGSRSRLKQALVTLSNFCIMSMIGPDRTGGQLEATTGTEPPPALLMTQGYVAVTNHGHNPRL